MIIATSTPVSAQPLDNASVVKMVSAGLPQDTIVLAIQKATEVHFDLSTSELISLKTSGVPDGIVIAMLRTASPTDQGPSEGASGGGDAEALVFPIYDQGRIEIGPGDLTVVLARGRKAGTYHFRWSEVAFVCFEFMSDGDMYLKTKAGTWVEATSGVSMVSVFERLRERVPSEIRIYSDVTGQECPEETP